MDVQLIMRRIAEFNLKGYNIISNDLDINSRGIILYIDKNIEFSIIENSIAFREYVLIKIKLIDKTELLVCVVYRSPNSSDDNNKLMFDLLRYINKFNKDKFIIIGDFNFPGIDWDHWITRNKNKLELEFINLLQDNFLIQHVTFPTRARGNDDPHILDLIITNIDFINCIENLSPLGKSDHAVLNVISSIQSSNTQNQKKFNFGKGNYNGLANSLDLDWESILLQGTNDIDVMWSKFKVILFENCTEFIPQTNNFDSWKKNNWKCTLPKEIRKNIKKKNRLWTRYMETKDNNTLNKYKLISNQLRTETRNILRKEQSEIAKSCKKNPKKFWNYIKSRTKNYSNIGDIKYKNTKEEVHVAKTNEEKAEAFCDYFSSVFTQENEDEFENLQQKNPITEMTDICFNIEDIKQKLKNLNVNKSAGPDNIHPRILKEACDVLALPLKIIFENSFKQNKLPSDWITANISAIFKKGSKLEVNNYRPISLTCICCKIMESMIRDEIFKFFINNKFFSKAQFGFIKGRSTVLQLLKILDEWTKLLESGGQIDVIYTDFEKAFDKVPHKRLISKLKSYGINKNVTDWIESFLLLRKQRVKINDSFSEWQKVMSGIPQGSILGPLLFIIYINDLVENCDINSKLYLYADDAKLFNYITNDMDVENLQKNLNRLTDWSTKWLLKLNIQKCKVISYSSKDLKTNSEYHIIGNNITYPLEKLDFITDLGVTFDRNLKFNIHINDKIKKAYSILGIIKRNFKLMTGNAFIQIYKSMVRSHLEYANSVWAPHRVMDIENLERVQKRATKMIYNLKKMSYEDRLKNLNLPTLKYRRLRGDMIETYKIITNKYDEDSVVNLNINENSNTRGNRYKLTQNSIHYNLRQNFFTNRIVSVWNCLPDEVVTAKNTNTFKNLLDKFWNNQEFKFNYKLDITGTGSRSLRENLI